MLRLVFAFVDIMLHRRGPDSLPSSPFLLWALFVASLTADLFVTWLGEGAPRSFAVAALVFGLNVWFVWALLRTFNRQPRFRQTMTAWLGANVLLALLQAPLARSVLAAPPPDPQNPMLTLASLLWLLILFWALDIAAFVFSRALERPYLLCLAVMIGYALLIESLQATLLRPIA